MGRNPIAERFSTIMIFLISIPGIVLMIIGFLCLIPAILSQVTSIPLSGVWEILFTFFFTLGAFLVYLPRYIDWLVKRMDPTDPTRAGIFGREAETPEERDGSDVGSEQDDSNQSTSDSDANRETNRPDIDYEFE